MRLSRRILLASSAAGAAVAVPTAGWAQSNTHPTLDADPFTLGVASGDPEPDGVVLWTRLAVNPLAEADVSAASAGDVEPVGVGELAFVAVGRAGDQDDASAGGNGGAGRNFELLVFVAAGSIADVTEVPAANIDRVSRWVI